MQQHPWEQEIIIRHSQRLINSFHHWTGKVLIEVNGSPKELSQVLFTAPFVVVSHGTEVDPIFNYGNRLALELWELSWEELTKMPSRKTAEPILQEERHRLLSEAATQGFAYYSGIRISSTGKRFHIEDGILWNLMDEDNQYCGQAAVFDKFKFIN